MYIGFISGKYLLTTFKGRLQPYFILGIGKRWREAHGCNGQRISLECERDEVMWFVRTFYGVSKRQPKACFFTPGDCVSSDQGFLSREFASRITAYRKYVTRMISIPACGELADYRQDYYYCVKGKNINFTLTLTLSRQ